MVELLALCDHIARKLDQISIPCVAIQSNMDEMVSPRASTVLRNSGRVQVLDLPNSTHFYYTEADRQTILRAFEQIL
jgi:esterase/lipase